MVLVTAKVVFTLIQWQELIREQAVQGNQFIRLQVLEAYQPSKRGERDNYNNCVKFTVVLELSTSSGEASSTAMVILNTFINQIFRNQYIFIEMWYAPFTQTNFRCEMVFDHVN